MKKHMKKQVKHTDNKKKGDTYKPSKREVEARKYADKNAGYKVDDDKSFPWEAHKKWCGCFWRKWNNE